MGNKEKGVGNTGKIVTLKGRKRERKQPFGFSVINDSSKMSDFSNLSQKRMKESADEADLQNVLWSLVKKFTRHYGIIKETRIKLLHG